MRRHVGQHHGDLRRALLDAALELVAEENVDAVTLRAVARRAGVTPAACYHHFADKGALLAEVGREGFEALAHELLRAGRRPPQARLAALATTYVRFALAHLTHYRVMFRVSPSEVEGQGGEALRTAARTCFDLLGAAIAAVVPDTPPAECARRALVAWAVAHGAVDVARWSDALVPGFDPQAFAVRVGASVMALAETGSAQRNGAPRGRRRASS